MSRCMLPKRWVAFLGIVVIILAQLVTEAPGTHGASSPEAPSRRKLARIHRHLGRINKPAVKTIQVSESSF